MMSGNDKSNYRPICLSNICSKIIEGVVFDIINTSCNVFLIILGLKLNMELNCVYLGSKSYYA